MRGSAAVLVCVGLGRQTGGLPGLLQCASGPCVVGRADARPDTKGCRTARPLPMGRALPWSLSDADRGVTSDQRRRWRAGRRARVRRLSRHSRAVRQLHALLMPSRQRRGGLPAHGTRRSNDVGFLRIRHPQVHAPAFVERRGRSASGRRGWCVSPGFTPRPSLSAPHRPAASGMDPSYIPRMSRIKFLIGLAEGLLGIMRSRIRGRGLPGDGSSHPSSNARLDPMAVLRYQ